MPKMILGITTAVSQLTINSLATNYGPTVRPTVETSRPKSTLYNTPSVA